jgi:cation transport regulator
MPYATNADLAASVRTHLPRRAQGIYREAFNHTWREYWVDENAAHRIAWSTVKRSYHKDANGTWVALQKFTETGAAGATGARPEWTSYERLPESNHSYLAGYADAPK